MDDDIVDGDEPVGLASEAGAEALKAAVEYVDEAGGSMLAGFAMTLVVEPDAPDNTAKAGLWIHVDDDGPAEPEEMLGFLLAGVQQFAASQGLNLALAPLPEVKGQG